MLSNTRTDKVDINGGSKNMAYFKIENHNIQYDIFSPEENENWLHKLEIGQADNKIMLQLSGAPYA